jgi:hypothetical protein
MLAVEVARDGINQDRKGGCASQAAGLAYREYPFYPPIALRVVGALHQLTPEHGEPQGPVELSEGIAPPAGLQNRACPFRGTRLLS